MLAQAMSSTMPVTTNSSVSGARDSLMVDAAEAARCDADDGQLPAIDRLNAVFAFSRSRNIG